MWTSYEKTATGVFDTIMEKALQWVGLWEEKLRVIFKPKVD